MNFNNAHFKTSYGMLKQIPESKGVEIVFAGRSNVGKSSAINKIFNRKSLARVSSMPGKTATINFYGVDDVDFVDLPGYGYAKVGKSEKQKWSKLIEGYFNQTRNIALVIVLVDMRHPITELDLQMIEFLQAKGLHFIIVATKCDKLNKTQTQQRKELMPKEISNGENITIIPFSSTKGYGVEEVIEQIKQVAQDFKID